VSDDVRERWDGNAAFWDEWMGDEGNDWHLKLVRPAVERLLGPVEGRDVLEIACGNGLFARRLSALGARVVATDFSEPMLERARARSSGEPISYEALDVTDESALAAVPGAPFDAVVSNMALMDIERLEPLAAGLQRLLRPGGRFVFSTTHPAFNRVGMRMVAEQEEQRGEIVTRRGVLITSYLRPRREEGIALLGQPRLQLYFDRSFTGLLSPFFEAGLQMDGIEEPAFPDTGDESLSWDAMPDIPPVVVARLRRPQ
jgi:2-polyprenyl-3-methyl-5-hydroxy-6-metoxy-1,4-benzoquinol methylase